MFWNVFLIVLVILILSILGITLFALKPEPVTIGKATVLPLTGISTVTGIMPPDKKSPEVRFNIDVSHRIGKYQKMTGWLFVKNQQTKGQEVYVQFEKPEGTVVHYSTMPMKRPDVVSAFKNPLYNSSGFSALILLEDGLDINAYTTRFVVKNQSGTYKSPIWKAGIRFSSRAKISVPEIGSPLVKFNVDVNEERRKGIATYRYLCGWVYVTGQQTKGQKVYVQFEKPEGTVVHYLTMPMERPDVVAAFKNPLYNSSGFKALILLEDGLDINACKARFVVKNQSGTYKSPKWKARIKVNSRAIIALQK
jgi:hypothetical protein